MSRRLLLSALMVAVGLLFGLSLIVGKVWVPLWGMDDPGWWIILELRLPRTVLAVLIGGVLGLSGAVLQGYLRNPLADPGLLGVSACAALGAVLSLFFGLTGLPWVLPAFAMAGAVGAMLLLRLLVGESGSLIAFTLAGVVLSSVANALTALVISLAPNPFAVGEIITWLMGALTDRSFDDVLLASPFMVIGTILLLLTGRALDALTLGEATARSLGVGLGRLQWLVVAGVGLTVGAAVAVTGVISFVGLVVPHLLRPLVGDRPSALLLPSALGGAALMLAADSLVRLTPGGAELKLGIAMAALGGPFFLMLLFKWRRQIL